MYILTHDMDSASLDGDARSRLARERMYRYVHVAITAPWPGALSRSGANDTISVET